MGKYFVLEGKYAQGTIRAVAGYDWYVCLARKGSGIYWERSYRTKQSAFKKYQLWQEAGKYASHIQADYNEVLLVQAQEHPDGIQ